MSSSPLDSHKINEVCSNLLVLVQYDRKGCVFERRVHEKRWNLVGRGGGPEIKLR